MSRFFFLLLVCFSLTSFSSYAADSDTYFIQGVPVNTTGKSPAASKATAHAMARRDAFLILLTRLEMKVNVADSVTDDELSDMVRSEQIENEKMAGSNYSATFNIMFAKDFVEHILAQKNSTAVQVKPVEDSYLLIPVKMKKFQPILWGEDNDWKKAIAKTLNKKSLNKFIIPDSDLGNIATLNDKNVISPDYFSLEPILTRYKASAAYVLIFSYDEIENKVLIEVVRVSKLQKKQVKLSFLNVDLLNYELLMDKVAGKSIDYLLTEKNQISPSANSELTRIKILVNNFGKWLMIKNKIESSNLVTRLNIESISRDFVVITVSYTGTGTIQEGFARQGIQLVQQADNSFVIDAN